MRRFTRGMRKRSSLPLISLVPLIDTVLVLLVIFMVTAPMMRHAVSVDLATGNLQEGKNISEDIVVILGPKGTLYINDLMVRKESFASLLKQKISAARTKSVFVDVDKSVPAGIFIELIDQIKSMEGVERVILDTQAARLHSS